jgi:hypothetical protein
MCAPLKDLAASSESSDIHSSHHTCFYLQNSVLVETVQYDTKPRHFSYTSIKEVMFLFFKHFQEIDSDNTFFNCDVE